MKKIIYAIGLSLAVVTLAFGMQSCSEKPAVTEVETRTDIGVMPELPTLPYLHVNFINAYHMQFRWLHCYQGSYDFIHIHKSEREISPDDRPLVEIEMGTDPFAYELLLNHTHQHIPVELVGYKDWNYQAFGVSYENGALTVKWATQVFISSEPVYRPVGAQTN